MIGSSFVNSSPGSKYLNIFTTTINNVWMKAFIKIATKVTLTQVADKD